LDPKGRRDNQNNRNGCVANGGSKKGVSDSFNQHQWLVRKRFGAHATQNIRGEFLRVGLSGRKRGKPVNKLIRALDSLEFKRTFFAAAEVLTKILGLPVGDLA
jgi:hypothetical protein